MRKSTILNLRNSLQTPSLDDILLGNFTLPNPIILVEDKKRWNRGFEIFLIDHYAGGISPKRQKKIQFLQVRNKGIFDFQQIPC